MIKMLTQEYLKTILHYDPLTGRFAWINGNINNPENMHNGFVNYKGYLMLQINGKHYRQHRLAWLYMTGEWPKNQIDHKDTIKHHNVWSNLREADNQANHYNLPKPKNNTSGAKGVIVRKRKNGNVYEAKIKHNQKTITIGYFTTLELASQAYLDKAKELANEFANAG